MGRVRAKKEWNTRYVAYAAAHGNSPERQMEIDDREYPGGKMVGYILWLPEMWRRWEKETGERPRWAGCHSDRQHELFDKWLSNLVGDCDDQN